MTSQYVSPLSEHNSLSGDSAAAEVGEQLIVPTETPGLETQQFTNPFDNGRDNSDGAATPSPVSGDPREHRQESKRAPTCAIFDDLTTAVSSIRSGSARGRYRSDSHQASDVADEDTAIPLQDLQPIRHQGDGLAALDLPIPSQAARLSQLNWVEFDNVTFSARDELPPPITQPHRPEKSWNPLRRTLAVFSSSFTGGGSSEVPSRLPRNSSDPIEPIKRRTSGRFSGIFQNGENALFATPSRHGNNGGNWSMSGKRGAESSLQEGSTIDNIVRQYKGSDVESNVGVGNDSRGRTTTSFNPHLSQLSDDSFFSDSDEEEIPRSHPGIHQRTQHLTKGHVSQPPRYNIPRLPNNGLTRSDARNDLASEDSCSNSLNLTSREVSGKNTNNPFRIRRNRNSTRFALDEGSSSSENGQARQPLEHDIMQLRHRSDYSTYSTDSLQTNLQDTLSAGPSRHTQGAQLQLERNLSEVVSVDEETRRLAEPVLFYNQASIDPNWNMNDDNNGLRVPIRKPTRHGNSKRHDLGASRDADSNLEGDQDDWETVVTEPADHEAVYRRGFGGRTIGQTESSIVDNSENGTFSTRQEVSGFSSTDRIVQHPGEIHYHGDYRQLDLKNTKVPVMAPKYGAHRINGYAADSMRIRQPYPYYMSPSPLATTHRNPFNSQPPEVMSPKVRQPTGMPKPHRGKNHFPPSSKASSVMTDSSEAFPRARILQPKPARTTESKARTNVRAEVGSLFSTQSSLFVGHDGQNQRSSWDHITTFANGGSVPGYNHDGSRTNPYNGLPDSSEYQMSRTQADGFTEVSLHGGRNPNFEDRPTNKTSRRHSGKDPRNYFAYRSPLAPPQRDSCRALYTKSQLGRIDFAGETAGMSRAARHSQFDLGFERRTAFGGLRQRQTYDLKDASRRRRKISNVCLGLCNLFPPLLILYATGNLDVIIFWWSKAEFARFKARQKRWAWYLVGVWASILIVILVIFLIVWKAHGAHGQKGT
jgi:hypothetical protein